MVCIRGGAMENNVNVDRMLDLEVLTRCVYAGTRRRYQGNGVPRGNKGMANWTPTRHRRWKSDRWECPRGKETRVNPKPRICDLLKAYV